MACMSSLSLSQLTHSRSHGVTATAHTASAHPHVPSGDRTDYKCTLLYVKSTACMRLNEVISQLQCHPTIKKAYR